MGRGVGGGGGGLVSTLIIVTFVVERRCLQRAFQVVPCGGWLLCVISLSAKQKKFGSGEMKTCQWYLVTEAAAGYVSIVRYQLVTYYFAKKKKREKKKSVLL